MSYWAVTDNWNIDGHPFGSFYSFENHKLCPLEKFKRLSQVVGGEWMQAVATTFPTYLPGLRTSRAPGYGIPAGWNPSLRRCWLPGPGGVTHPSFSIRAGKPSRTSCVLWKTTSLVPQLSPFCKSRLTSSFTPWNSKYHTSVSVFQVQVLCLAFSKWEQ